MKGQEGVKVPLFSKIFNFGAQYLGNKIFYSKVLKGFFYPQDKENRFHPFFSYLTAVQKNTLLGGHPHLIFFSTHKPHSEDLSGSEKHHFKGIWISGIFSSFWNIVRWLVYQI